MHRNCAIPPRILKLVAPVRNKRQLNAKLPRGSIKAPRLISQLPRKNQNSFHVRSYPKKLMHATDPDAGISWSAAVMPPLSPLI